MAGIKIELHPNSRGFLRADFVDEYGAACSIQKSSLATADAIWLGIDRVTPQVLVAGEGWKDVPLPDGALSSGRMHLTREQVAALLPLLQRFVDTGELE